MWPICRLADRGMAMTEGRQSGESDAALAIDRVASPPSPVWSMTCCFIEFD